jgi:NAD(P)-dependent dehydrogenase (short-subunit alcohol dehydrogenase family)
MELNGKVAFITGGGGGIGEGMAEAFVEKGMRVVLADIDQAKAQAVAKRFGDAAMAVELDVTSLHSWALARERALAHFGEVDVLCNNAGISIKWQPLVDLDPELFDRTIAINLKGVFNGVKTFGHDLIARKSGHIVNTSSLNGLLSMGSMGPYAASKFAVTALTKALRDEMAPHGVGVTAVYPGLTRSGMSLDISKANEPHMKSMQMMEPVWLGRAVVRAIEINEPHVITHPSAKPALEAWQSELLGAFGEPAEPGYKG